MHSSLAAASSGSRAQHVRAAAACTSGGRACAVWRQPLWPAGHPGAHLRGGCARAMDLDMPDIDGDLRSVQEELGAQFDEQGVVRTYGNARQALGAVETGVALVDRSHWGRIRVGGDDRLAFLHNQSTNEFKELRAGQGCDTVFVTSTARTLDLATTLVNQSNVLVIVSPSMRQQLLERFDKYIFPADKVEVRDVSEQCAMLSLVGPESEAVLRELAGDTISIYGQPYGTHQILKFSTGPIIVSVGSGLAAPGYTLLVDESVSGELFALLASKGCVLMGEDEWSCARILSGRPAVGAELVEDFNPLEAGLFNAVSVEKGCYIGQETLSKLVNLDAVKQQLWGLDLEGPVEAGADVTDAEGTRLGRVTSCTSTPGGRHFALAYVKCKSRGKQVDVEGMEVKAGGVAAKVAAIPFATRAFAKAPAISAAGAAEKAAAEEERSAKEVEGAAKAARLQAMQEQLKQYQAQVAAAQQKQ